MKNLKNKTLVASLLSIVACCAIFIGIAFAWFTSTVSNSGNKIKTGSVAVKLLQNDGEGNYVDISKDTTPVFNEANWIPGEPLFADLRVQYAGSIDAYYEVTLKGLENLNQVTTKGFENVVDVYINNSGIGCLADLADGKTALIKGQFSQGDTVPLYIELSLDNNVGPEYMEAELPVFDIQVYATQVTNKDYVPANSPVATKAKTTLIAEEDTQLVTDIAEIEIPKNTLSGEKVEFVANNSNDFKVEVPEEANTLASVELSLKVDDVEVHEFVSPLLVTLVIAKNLEASKIDVVYTGTYQIADDKLQPFDVTYDPSTGILTFKTWHFSEFIVLGDSVVVTNDAQLQDAIINANLNDVIFLTPGNYVQNITINTTLTLRGLGETKPVLKGKVVVNANDVKLVNIHILHTYIAVKTQLVDSRLFDMAADETLFIVKGLNITLDNCIIERSSVVMRAYGWILEYTNAYGVINTINTKFIAPTPRLPGSGDPCPSVIGFTSMAADKNAKLVMNGGSIETNGFGMFDWHVSSFELTGVTFKGTNQVRGDNSSYYGIMAFINNMNVAGSKFINCTFTENYSTGMIIAGNFTVEDCTFKNPWTADKLYIGLYSNNGNVVIKNNTFNLTGIATDQKGSQKHYGIRLTTDSWAPQSFLTAQVNIEGNTFVGTGYYAVRNDFAVWYNGGTLTLVNNNFNGNANTLGSQPEKTVII